MENKVTKIDRREFLKRAAILGVSIPIGGSLLGRLGQVAAGAEPDMARKTFEIASAKGVRKHAKYKYSWNVLVYFGEPWRNGIDRLSKFGYDGVELIGDAELYKPYGEAARYIKDKGLEVSNICSLFTNDRDFASPDPTIRENAVEYVKSMVDLANGVGSPGIIVAPSAVMKISGYKDAVVEREWAVEGIRKASEYASDAGIRIVLEAWNRYETYFVNRVDQLLQLKKDIGEDLKNVGVMGDTFHMNMEEFSITDAFKSAGEYLFHVHFADSNRSAPGKGHTDFVKIMRTLRDMNYDKYVSMEIFPPAADPFGVFQKGGGEEFFDQYTELAIKNLRKWELTI